MVSVPTKQQNPIFSFLFSFSFSQFCFTAVNTAPQQYSIYKCIRSIYILVYIHIIVVLLQQDSRQRKHFIVSGKITICSSISAQRAHGGGIKNLRAVRNIVVTKFDASSPHVQLSVGDGPMHVTDMTASCSPETVERNDERPHRT